MTVVAHTTPPDTATRATKRAVAYLRVSTPRQARTDVGSDGFSLETQREAAYKLAAARGAEIVDEYIDTDTGTKTSSRRALQALLDRLKTQRDVDYVIIFKLDRWARNRLDDASTSLAVHQAGAELISCNEYIDSSAVGKLNHGIMAAVNEYYSDNLSNELKAKMAQKVKRGGTPGVCALGYLNVRENVDGKNIGTVKVDPERGPIIKWGLEAFSSGDYTIASLTDALNALGLTTRPTARQGGKPITTSFVGRMLRNPYYMGLITWGEIQAPGNHDPLISVETFAKNQALLESRRAGEKQRTYPHYLRSTIFCHRCGSRMIFNRATGRRGGTYDYFFCVGRHQKRTDCDLPYLAVADVEAAIDAHYAHTELITDHQQATLRQMIDAELDKRSKRSKTETTRQTKRIQRLEAQRTKLLDAYLDGGVPIQVLKRKQEAISADLVQAEQAIAAANVEADTIRRNLDIALSMITDAHTSYREAPDDGRRHWNHAMFDRIEVDYQEPVYTRLAEPFAQLVEPELLDALELQARNPGRVQRLGGGAATSVLATSTATESPFCQGGSKEHYLAERVGFEPTVPVGTLP